jgi:hypothetical protein
MTESPTVGSVYILCRYFAACKYQAAGPEDDVRANYKQHLREHHGLGHPRVEPDEIQGLAPDAVVDQATRWAPVPRRYPGECW